MAFPVSNKKAIAIITGDVHFTLETLEVATTAVQLVLKKAEQLGVPAILNGDTLDSKAIIRAECANRLIELLTSTTAKVIINTGNHDLLNEKSKHSSLQFLKPYAEIVDPGEILFNGSFQVVPYYRDKEEFKQILQELSTNHPVVLHQGVVGAQMGHYIQDKTSLSPEAFSNHRVVASHYHRRQDIKCGHNIFSYIGNPYTLSFGEAFDPEKGFQILYNDGSLEFVATNLRKHVIINEDLDNPKIQPKIGVEDLVWVKLTGSKDALKDITREHVKQDYDIPNLNFKLDLIPIDEDSNASRMEKTFSNSDLFDKIIDSSNNNEDFKNRSKNMWRSIYESGQETK